MKIWKHFFFLFIKTVVAVLFLILAIYFIITYIENSLYYFKNRTISTNTILSYYFWQIPDIALQILPFAVLISGIIIHWILSRNGEISALRSAGMSLWRVSFPLICGALFYTCVNFAVSEFVRPYAYKKFYFIKNNLIENRAEKNLFSTTTWIKTKTGIVHFQNYDPINHFLMNAEYFKYQSSQSAKDSSTTNFDFIAKSSLMYFDKKKQIWVMDDASVLKFASSNTLQSYRVINLETDMYFQPPKLLRDDVNSDELSFFELSKLIKSAKNAQIQVQNRIADLYFKISLPFSNLIFLLFTMPFALQSARKEVSYSSILLCLALTVSYSIAMMGLKYLAGYGIIPPFVAAWGLNILFVFLSIIFIAKLDKPA